MQRFSFYDKEKNKSTIDSLANALASRRQSQVNTGSISAPYGRQETNEGADIMNGALRFGKGLYNMYNKGKDNGWFNFGSQGTTSEGPQLLKMSDYTSAGGNGGFEGFDNLSFNGLGSNSTTSAGGGFKGFGGFGGGSGGGSTPWGAIGSFAKGGYNSVSGHDDSDYSDLEQSTIYPMQGASKGAQFGPWGAAAGALYGLGYSFKDDIGLKDNDWLTDIIFPIGMGDEHRGLITI